MVQPRTQPSCLPAVVITALGVVVPTFLYTSHRVLKEEVVTKLRAGFEKVQQVTFGGFIDGKCCFQLAHSSYDDNT